MTTTIWSLSDLAREVGLTRQAVLQRTVKGHLPAPRYRSVTGTPYWSEAQAQQIIDSWKPDTRRKRGQ